MMPNFKPFRTAVLCGLFATAAIVHVRADYTWRNVSIGGGGYVSGMEFHPTTPGLLYCRTDVGGAYRWNPANSRWIPLNDDIGGLNNDFMQLGVLGIGLDRSDPERVYLACGQYSATWAPYARLRSSTNRGLTWTTTTLPFRIEGNQNGRGTGERLAVDPSDGTILYFGTSIDGLWRSTNRGANWTRMTDFPAVSTNFVLCDPSAPGTVYASAATITDPTLWKSTDYGVTWAAVGGQPAGLMALQGKLDPAGNLYLTFGNAGGPNGVTAGAVWKLAGTTWTNISPPAGQGGFCGISLDRQTPGRIIVSTVDRWYPRDQIYLSSDDGASWSGKLDGATLDRGSAPWSASLTPHWTTDVEIDPFDTRKAWFVTGFGVFGTDNLGVASGLPTWIFKNSGLEESVPSGLVSPSAGAPLVSAIMDFDGFRHDSLDASPPLGRHTPHKGSTSSLDGAGNAPAVMAKISGSSGAISRDGGTTWTVFTGAPPTAVNGSGQVAVSADGTRLLWCPVESPAYFSNNDGQTWTLSANSPGGANVTVWPAADRVDPTRFYLFDTSARVVHISSDAGATFAQGATGLPAGSAAISAVPGMTGHLWLNVFGAGLWRSTDFGAHFAKVASVEQGNRIGYGRAPEGGAYPALYMWGRVGGVTGIYRSDDAAAGWIRINDDAHQFGYINDIIGDPRVYGRVYMGTSGRGIIVGETVVPVLPSQTIYENALSNGWNNWSWATVGMASATPTRRGPAAMSVNAGGYQALYLNHAAMSTSGYSALGFWIHGGTTGGQSLKMIALKNGVAQTAWNLPAPVAGTWTRVLVPLAALGVADVGDFNGLWIQNRLGTAQPVFYVDDIAVVSDGDSDWSATGFDAWRQRNFTSGAIANPDVSGAMADPDKDGLSNQMEWFLLGDPWVSDPSSSPNLALVGNTPGAGSLKFQYARRTEPGMPSISPESSSDLINWTPLSDVSGAFQTLTPLDISGLAEQVVWTVPTASRPRFFVRLH